MNSLGRCSWERFDICGWRFVALPGAHDPSIFATVPVVLALVALAAAWLPAWRAGGVDPKSALAEE